MIDITTIQPIIDKASLEIRKWTLNEVLLHTYDNDAITKRIEALIDETNQCILGLEQPVDYATN